MSILTSVQLPNFLETFIESINNAVDLGVDNTKYVTFTVSSIELNMICSLEYNNKIYIIPSNAFVKNYYKKGDDVVINIRIKPKPLHEV